MVLSSLLWKNKTFLKMGKEHVAMILIVITGFTEV